MATTFHPFSLEEPAAIARYVADTLTFHDGETIVRMSRAGEGNMNLVVRVETSHRSVILKQSRPWVEKYPEIEAPLDRIHFEVGFYEAVARYPDLAGGMPRLLHADAEAHAMLMEDMGNVSDCTLLYADPGQAADLVPPMVRWLSHLHGSDFAHVDRGKMANRELRALNHAHLFVIPFADDNGIDLDGITPGLRSMALKLQNSPAYRRELARLGERYLSDGELLLHGDFYPGSWVRSVNAVRVIDPEFAFFGPSEYDVGVLIAHLLMAGLEEDTVRGFMSAYAPRSSFDVADTCRFAGMEIMRRVIGVAQLPMERTLEQKTRLLGLSERLMLTPGDFSLMG